MLLAVRPIYVGASALIKRLCYATLHMADPEGMSYGTGILSRPCLGVRNPNVSDICVIVNRGLVCKKIVIN